MSDTNDRAERFMLGGLVVFFAVAMACIVVIVVQRLVCGCPLS